MKPNDLKNIPNIKKNIFSTHSEYKCILHFFKKLVFMPLFLENGVKIIIFAFILSELKFRKLIYHVYSDE